MPNRALAMPKADELIGRLGTVASADTADELAIRRIQNDAKRLMNSDPAGAHTVMGGVAALLGNLDEVHTHHRVALGLKPSPITHFNYSVSLSLLGEMDGALDAIKSGLAETPDNPWLVAHTIRLAMEAAHFTEALGFCDCLKRLAPDGKPHAESESAELAANAVYRGFFREEKAQEVVNLFGSVQRSKGYLGLTGVSVSVLRPDPAEDGSFLYERYIKSTPTEAAALNVQFADHLATHEALLDDPGLRFVPVFVGAQHGDVT